jgi:hypothetical protein
LPPSEPDLRSGQPAILISTASNRFASSGAFEMLRSNDLVRSRVVARRRGAEIRCFQRHLSLLGHTGKLRPVAAQGNESRLTG